ncbi:hypothetical protein Q604_UNBC16286G0001, partial [human gut metagenome]
VSGRIPFDEALKYMLNGDILLLFGNKNSKQIPAKIYDYFGAKGFISLNLEKISPVYIILILLLFINSGDFSNESL